MAKAYTIQVLDAQGGVILSTRGRTGALGKAIDALGDYRRSCYASSGMLFANGAGLASRDGAERVVAGGYTLDAYDDAQDVIARLDRAA